MLIEQLLKAASLNQRKISDDILQQRTRCFVYWNIEDVQENDLFGKQFGASARG